MIFDEIKYKTISWKQLLLRINVQLKTYLQANNVACNRKLLLSSSSVYGFIQCSQLYKTTKTIDRKSISRKTRIRWPTSYQWLVQMHQQQLQQQQHGVNRGDTAWRVVVLCWAEGSLDKMCKSKHTSISEQSHNKNKKK